MGACPCGRDRVRWPVPLAGSPRCRLAVGPAAIRRMLAAGSLVLRRMDRRGHKRGLVRAKKHDTKSGGVPLRRGSFFDHIIINGYGK